jgi:hypothetical protein
MTLTTSSFVRRQAPGVGSSKPTCIHCCMSFSLCTHPFGSARAPNQSMIGMLIFDPARGHSVSTTSMTLARFSHSLMGISVNMKCTIRRAILLGALCARFDVACTLHENKGVVCTFQRRAFEQSRLTIQQSDWNANSPHARYREKAAQSMALIHLANALCRVSTSNLQLHIWH